jgi:hypothetical protein
VIKYFLSFIASPSGNGCVSVACGAGNDGKGSLLTD